MKQTMGILILLLVAGIAGAQNPATILQNTKTVLQGAQQQKQTNSSAASPAKAKASAQASKPVSNNNAPKVQNAKPVAVAVKTPAPASKSAQKASAPIAHNAAPAAQNAKSVAVKAAPVSKPAAVPVAHSTAPATQTAKVSPAKTSPVAVKPVATKSTQVSIKPAVANATPKVKAVPVAAVKAKEPSKTSTPAIVPVSAAKADEAKVDVKDTNAKPEGSEKKEQETSKLISITGRRDPFVSPVVNQNMTGSGCSVGKKCLSIDQITIRGVVKADSGMIAVVVNALDKAYFLRENDPVFNGYVEKITEDSIIFKETFQDKLGKPFTKDVTKRIQAPAV